jgi:hypothetical protein
MNYSDGVTKIMLGDKVCIRRLLRRALYGTVTYVPGVSKPHCEMVSDFGVEYFAINVPAKKTVCAWVYEPGGVAPKRIEFLERAEPGPDTLKPEDELT